MSQTTGEVPPAATNDGGAPEVTDSRVSPQAQAAIEAAFTRHGVAGEPYVWGTMATEHAGVVVQTDESAAIARQHLQRAYA